MKFEWNLSAPKDLLTHYIKSRMGSVYVQKLSFLTHKVHKRESQYSEGFAHEGHTVITCPSFVRAITGH